MFKKILKCGLLFITLIVVICLGIIVNGSCLKIYNNHNKDYSKWMEKIGDKQYRKLNGQVSFGIRDYHYDWEF